MVRSLVYIACLSTALVGCGDSSGGMAGTGGSAGTSGMGGMAGVGGAGGMGGLAGDACLDDLDILADIEDLNTLVVEQCVLGRNCAFMEVAPCVAECLEEEVGLPQDCGLCVGLVTECILRACLTDCTDPESTACDECVAAVTDECNEVYEPCAGFPVP